jgi:hypothetical protein
MKTLTKIGYAIGVAIILLSIIRWWFIYFDISQAFFGSLVGFIICGFAYLYDWMVVKEMKIRSLDIRIDSLVVELKNKELIKHKGLVIE